MTYKKIDFNEGATMRSFERIAHKHGWIQEEHVSQIVKEASLAKTNKLDLTPSKDLMQNLLKLATGLRAKGMEDYAEKLEDKIATFKSAETADKLYGPDHGEALIEEAHPEGSPNVGDGEDGDVETILDQHEKIKEIAKKDPTGKEACNKIIKDVLIVLAEDQDDSEGDSEKESEEIQTQEDLKKNNAAKKCKDALNVLRSAITLFNNNKKDTGFFDNFGASALINSPTKPFTYTAMKMTSRKLGVAFNTLKACNETDINASLLTEAMDDLQDVLNNIDGWILKVENVDSAQMRRVISLVRRAKDTTSQAYVIITKPTKLKSVKPVSEKQAPVEEAKENTETKNEETENKIAPGGTASSYALKALEDAKKREVSPEDMEAIDSIKNEINVRLSELSSEVNSENADLNNPQINSTLTQEEKNYTNRYLGILHEVIGNLNTVIKNLNSGVPLNRAFAGTKYFANVTDENSFRAVLSKLDTTKINYKSYWNNRHAAK